MTRILTKKSIDRVTRQWIRDASDDRAAHEGYRFDVERGAYSVFWIERYCRLYEGDQAGEPMLLHGCKSCGTYKLKSSWDFPDWNDSAIANAKKRAQKFADCLAAGHDVDWQYLFAMRLFGWVHFDEHWRRLVRRFVEASVWVPKKNKKSPTLAAISLHVLAGDGEQGQKVFLGAKDGAQVRKIAAAHAVRMIRKSPELDEACKINRTTLEIEYLPTESLMVPLSSGNERHKEAKEGLNGSIAIDETHVVDDDFMGILEGAGISRSEPVHLEFSTAGNNPDGYGKRRFDKAVAVAKGTMYDPRFLSAVYAAPQDLSDAALDADPVKWGKLANPAWGHTINPARYLETYHKAKQGNLSDFGRWKMYRLNIWQRSTSPWIRMGDWELCKRDFTEEDLAGRPCIAGLDLSRTQDMSCLSLVFPWDDGTYRVLPYFWLPHDEAHEKNHLAPFVQWAADGWLTLTPGNVVDYGFIRARIRKLAERYLIRDLFYDKTYAEECTQAIEQGVVDDTGREVEAGCGISRTVFPQNIMAFTGPSKEFERLIRAKQFHHNGHPILTWQVGHVQVWRDANENIRPIKPKDGGAKKIDGVVATIMALAQAVKQPEHAGGGVEFW